MAKSPKEFKALTLALTLIGLVQLSLVSYAQTSGDRSSSRKGQVLFIQGAVRNPGVYEIEGRVSLVKLITLAGGLTENHGSVVYIIRPRGGQGASSDANNDKGPEYETTKVNIEGLLTGQLTRIHIFRWVISSTYRSQTSFS